MIVAVRYSSESPRRSPRRGGRDHVGLARQALERPRELRGGRLVARDERGHQFVAQLLLGHLRAVLMARASSIARTSSRRLRPRRPPARPAAAR